VTAAEPEGEILTGARFYVDQDLAGLGLWLMRLRTDVVVATHAPIEDLIPHYDADWIPVVAARGWVAILKDRHIRTRPGEADAALEHGLRCVHLYPKKKDARVWDYGQLLIKHWDAVEALHHRRGPVWLQLDYKHANPYERDYEPGKLPLVPIDPRPRKTARRHAASAKSIPSTKRVGPAPPDPLPFPE